MKYFNTQSARDPKAAFHPTQKMSAKAECLR